MEIKKLGKSEQVVKLLLTGSQIKMKPIGIDQKRTEDLSPCRMPL